MVDQIFVQEWVDFEVEMRHFFVEVDLHAPWKQVECERNRDDIVTKRRGEPSLKGEHGKMCERWNMTCQRNTPKFLLNFFTRRCVSVCFGHFYTVYTRPEIIKQQDLHHVNSHGGVAAQDRSTWKPKYIVYTVFKSRDDGCFRDFDKYDRQTVARMRIRLLVGWGWGLGWWKDGWV